MALSNKTPSAIGIESKLRVVKKKSNNKNLKKMHCVITVFLL